MVDVETQLRKYANWLGQRGDDRAAAAPDVWAASRAPGAEITARTATTDGDVPVLGDERPPRRTSRLLAAFAGAAAVVVLVVALAVVARPDSADAPASSTPPSATVPSPTTSLVPAPSTTAALTTTIVVPADVVTAEPDTVAPGGTVELRFSERAPRGTPWYMSPVDASRDAEPMYLLIAAFPGYDCIECPTWYGPGGSGEWAWDDIGREGPGPDTVVIPDVATPGDYELCTANAPVPLCVRITVTAPAPTTTVPESEVMTFLVDLPTGDIAASPDDLFVVHADGDLYLHRDALTGGGDQQLLADLADPRAPVAEGPGPNVVDDVAGLIDGALVYADCCEPVAGNVLAVTSPGTDPAPVTYGHRLALDPTGTHLAIAGYDGMSVVDLRTGTAVSRVINPSPSTAFLDVVDVGWTADSDDVVILASDVDSYVLLRFRNDESLTPAATVRLDFTPAESFLFSQLAGLGPSGQFVLVSTPAPITELRYLDPVTFEEDTALRRTLPEPVSSVRLAADGQSLLYVLDGELWYEPTGEQARVVATDATAAWFVGGATATS